MYKKILITGGNGFVGGFLINELSKDKSIKIIATYNNGNIPKIFKHCANLTWKKINLIDDNLGSILKDIELVYHLAAYSSLGSSPSERDLLNKVNVIGSERLAAACQIASVKKMVFVSSVAVCEGGSDLIISEENGCPLTPYGESKKKAEKLLKIYTKNSFDLIILRPTALFGEYHKGSIFELVKKVKQKRFVIFGSGQSLTNFYYIRDFIKILRLASIKEEAANNVYIAADEPHEIRTIIQWVLKSLESNFLVIKVPVSAGYFFAYIFEFLKFFTNRPLIFSLRRLNAMTNKKIFSNKKLVNDLNIEYEYGVCKGLEKTIDWYKKEGML